MMVKAIDKVEFITLAISEQQEAIVMILGILGVGYLQSDTIFQNRKCRCWEIEGKVKEVVFVYHLLNHGKNINFEFHNDFVK